MTTNTELPLQKWKRKISRFSTEELQKQQEEWCGQDRIAWIETQRKHRQKALEARIGRCGVPARFQNRSFDDYQCHTAEQRDALGVARSYADHFARVLTNGTSMLFVGNPGTGKTHLAAAILIAIIKRGYTGLFVSAYEAVMRTFDTYGGQGSAREAIRHFLQPDLLVLDEFGEQSGKPGETRVLFEILNQRYANLCPTLLLSNEDYGTVEKLLRPKGIDRLLEAGGVIQRFDWRSYRRRVKYTENHDNEPTLGAQNRG